MWRPRLRRDRSGSALFRLVLASGLLTLILALMWVFMLLSKAGPE